METNLSENSLILEQNYIQPWQYSEEEINFTGNAFRLEELSPDELFKRKLDFEREAMPHMKDLFNYTLKIYGNRPEAKELFGDTYTRAFRFFHKFEEGTNCKTWLFRIMRNCYINKYRRDNNKNRNG